LFCFSQETLKLVTEEVVVKLAGGRDFDDDPLSKFEASGIEASPDGSVLASDTPRARVSLLESGCWPNLPLHRARRRR
jgi:hypothetical protein